MNVKKVEFFIQSEQLNLTSKPPRKGDTMTERIPEIGFRVSGTSRNPGISKTID